MTEEVKVEYPIKLLAFNNGIKIVTQIKDSGLNNEGKSIIQALYPLEMMNSINPLTNKPFFMLLEFIPEKLINTPEITFKESDIMFTSDISEYLKGYYNKCLETIKAAPKESKEISVKDIIAGKLAEEMMEDSEEEFSNIKEGQGLEEFLRSLPLKPKDKLN